MTKSARLSGALWVLGGVGVGAGLMYWLDPRSGRRRRAWLEGKAVHVAHEAGDALETTARDLAHRTRGVLARASARLHSGEVEDVTLEERVRAALGRECSHPAALHVSARAGRVELAGAILKSELKRVLARAWRVPGVHALAHGDLEVYKEADGHPALQGGSGRSGARPELLQRHWSPTARLLVGAGSLGLLLYGLARRGWIGTFLGLSGLTFGLRSASNLELKRLTGVGAGRRAIELRKHLTGREEEGPGPRGPYLPH